MALFDIFKVKKRKDEMLKRPPKGALKQPAYAKASAGKPKPIEAIGEKEKQTATPEKSSELASLVLVSPHITEKSTIFAGRGVYAFKVNFRANKVMVERAIFELYGFKPRQVRILNMPGKPRFVRGKHGIKSGYKKALVYLKQGDKIELS